MREIKFRCYLKDTKELLNVVSIVQMNDEEGLRVFPEGKSRNWLESEGIIELMQYTGLKDKNGKEIYEGDIVKILYTDLVSKDENDNRTLEEYLYEKAETKVVIWNTQGFYVSSKLGGYAESMEHGKHGFIEIIGNIYENHELLGNQSK
ncbi:MAG TPA: YopX family protein [Candidatus Absconditabacterales bacterium]|nr:YopX family protein [Candidatus Absconditabacterales bacterium]